MMEPEPVLADPTDTPDYYARDEQGWESAGGPR